MKSNSVCNHTRDKQMGLPLRSSDFVITRMITDRIGRHKVLLSINHNNYNFREKKNNQVTHDQRDNLQGRRKFFLWLLLVNSNDNFECDWHFELSDNELSDNELSDNELSDDELSDNELSDDELSDNNLASELVENRSFFLHQSQLRKL